jgi:hypothetical protein
MLPLQVSVALSGYVLASMWVGGSANYSYPLYYDTGAGVQDHFLNWKVGAVVDNCPPRCPGIDGRSCRKRFCGPAHHFLLCPNAA